LVRLSLIVIVLERNMVLLLGVGGFFGTLIADGSKATSRRLECVMFFMSHVPRFGLGMEGEHHSSYSGE